MFNIFLGGEMKQLVNKLFNAILGAIAPSVIDRDVLRVRQSSQESVNANQAPTQNLAASGAIDPRGGDVVITKAGVAALTLAAPTSGVDDGLKLNVYSNTANAHTITCPGTNFTVPAGSKTVATFPANAGVKQSYMAFGGQWCLQECVSTANNAVTYA
jgi:hypothetical protein